MTGLVTLAEYEAEREARAALEARVLELAAKLDELIGTPCAECTHNRTERARAEADLAAFIHEGTPDAVQHPMTRALRAEATLASVSAQLATLREAGPCGCCGAP